MMTNTMSKILIAVVLVALVAALAAPALAATLTPEQENELAVIQNQIADLRKQMIDKLAEYGQITQDQADQMKARIDASQGYLTGCPCGAGWGMYGGRFRSRFQVQ
ncbi:MAG: DUF2680 domain-containing protein [Bacillota bacterium]